MDIDKTLDKRTDDWLKQQVAAGRLSQGDYEAVSLDRENSGCTHPEWKEWVGPSWIVGFKLWECEAYVNYPAWTMQEIADRLGMSVWVVRKALDRVRRKYLSLQEDPDGNLGLPNLSHMRPLDSDSYEDVSEDEYKF